MLADANGLIVGDQSTTLGRNVGADPAILADLGMPIATRPITGLRTGNKTRPVEHCSTRHVLQ
jgi:hypothetical protein